MCIFFELQPGSESLVGIKVATWKMTERRKQQYQKDQRYLSIEEMQQQQHDRAEKRLRMRHLRPSRRENLDSQCQATNS